MNDTKQERIWPPKKKAPPEEWRYEHIQGENTIVLPDAMKKIGEVVSSVQTFAAELTFAPSVRFIRADGCEELALWEGEFDESCKVYLCETSAEIHLAWALWRAGKLFKSIAPMFEHRKKGNET